jgi:hypothetical protein
MDTKVLWLVGQMINETDPDHPVWEFGGIFASEEKAIAACRADNYFIAPTSLDYAWPEESMVMPDSYYPRLETKDHVYIGPEAET